MNQKKIKGLCVKYTLITNLYHKVLLFFVSTTFWRLRQKFVKNLVVALEYMKIRKNIFWINGPLEGRGMTSTYGNTSYEVLSPGIRK